MNFILKTLITSLAIMVTAYILPGAEITNYFTGIVVAIVLSLLNTFLKPLLIVFTIPATIITLGLFLMVINAAIILLADRLIDGFYVAGFWTALFFSIILSIVTSIFVGVDKKETK
jgi:putative membrane protein